MIPPGPHAQCEVPITVAKRRRARCNIERARRPVFIRLLAGTTSIGEAKSCRRVGSPAGRRVRAAVGRGRRNLLEHRNRTRLLVPPTEVPAFPVRGEAARGEERESDHQFEHVSIPFVVTVRPAMGRLPFPLAQGLGRSRSRGIAVAQHIESVMTSKNGTWTRDAGSESGARRTWGFPPNPAELLGEGDAVRFASRRVHFAARCGLSSAFGATIAECASNDGRRSPCLSLESSQ